MQNIGNLSSLGTFTICDPSLMLYFNASVESDSVSRQGVGSECHIFTCPFVCSTNKVPLATSKQFTARSKHLILSESPNWYECYH